MENRRHTPEEISGRMNLMADIFQKDAQIFTLEYEKIEQMQQLYNLEMKMYGRMSKMAEQIFEVQHCEVLNGRVRKMTEAEWKGDTEIGDLDRPTGKNDTVRGKLNHYKTVEKQQADQTNVRMKEGRKKEQPELA